MRITCLCHPIAVLNVAKRILQSSLTIAPEGGLRRAGTSISFALPVAANDSFAGERDGLPRLCILGHGCLRYNNFASVRVGLDSLADGSSGVEGHFIRSCGSKSEYSEGKKFHLVSGSILFIFLII